MMQGFLDIFDIYLLEAAIARVDRCELEHG